MSGVPQLTQYQQGITNVSAAGLNTFEQTCDSVSDLRAFTGTQGMQVYMRGYSVPNDGGEGPFYWNATSTAADDNGLTTIVPYGSVMGCWSRLGTSGILGASNSSGVSAANGILTQITQLTIPSSGNWIFTSAYGFTVPSGTTLTSYVFFVSGNPSSPDDGEINTTISIAGPASVLLQGTVGLRAVSSGGIILYASIEPFFTGSGPVTCVGSITAARLS